MIAKNLLEDLIYADILQTYNNLEEDKKDKVRKKLERKKQPVKEAFAGADGKVGRKDLPEQDPRPQRLRGGMFLSARRPD